MYVFKALLEEQLLTLVKLAFLAAVVLGSALQGQKKNYQKLYVLSESGMTCSLFSFLS